MANGIALCRLHHGAYDNSLLGVQGDYAVAINPKAANYLSQTGFDAGLEAFRSALPQTIAVPKAVAARPAPENLRRGLEIRRWPRTLIV
jgi:putative restriction endonuclease